MTRERILAWIFVATLMAACGPRSADSAPHRPSTSNVVGILDRGTPTACPSGEPCDPPGFASSLIFTGAEGEQTRAGVDAAGHFAIQLEPGRYAVTATPLDPRARVVPSTVDVPPAGSISLHLRIMSGS